MDSKLADLLKLVKAEPGKGIQYAATLSNMAPVWVREEQVNSFMTKYCLLISSATGDFGLAEHVDPRQPVPVVVQGVFHYNKSTQIDFQAQDAVIYRIIAYYQHVMSEMMQLSNSRLELVAVRLDRSMDLDSGPSYYYRIQFPYCKVHIGLLPVIRDRVAAILQDENVMSILPSMPNNSWDSLLEGGILKTLTLFGSMPYPGVDALEFCDLYGIITTDMLDDPDSYHDRYNFISPEQHAFFKGFVVTTPSTDRKEKTVVMPPPHANFELWLPVLLSIYYCHGRTVPKGENISAQSIESGLSTPGGSSQHIPLIEPIEHGHKHRQAVADEEQWSIALRMIALLDPAKRNKIFFIRDVGKALFTTCHGDMRGLDEWIKFGQRVRTDTSSFADVWPNFTGNYLTLKTLMWYAREDSWGEYDRWHQAWSQAAMDAASSMKHAHVAKALYKTFMLDYTCSGVNLNSWYKFDNHHWCHIDKAYSFSIAVSDEFSGMFDRYELSLMQRKVDAKEQTEKDELAVKIENSTKLVSRLGDHTFKSKVLNEACNYFYDPNFTNRYDNSPTMVCVQTGVIEMDDNDFLFRDGKPEDYITMMTGVAYDKHLKWSSPIVSRLTAWITQLMVELDLIHVLQNYLGSIPFGGNLDKKLVVMTGPKDAGKSAFMRALFTAWGKYAIKGENGVLYGSKSGDGPSPSLARIRGTRVQSYEELETERGMLSSAFVKKATGNDTFFARMCNQNGGDIDPLQKTIMVCNLIPSFNAFDPATKERIFIIPFGSRWVDNAPHDIEEQMRTRTFPKDRFFNRHMLEMAKALLWCQVEWYSQYAKEGLPMPTRIQTVNSKYWADQDYYQKFIELNLLSYLMPDGVTRNHAFSVDVGAAFTRFQPWFKKNFPNYKPSNISTFTNGIAQHIGEPIGNKWFGYAMIDGDQV